MYLHEPVFNKLILIKNYYVNAPSEEYKYNMFKFSRTESGRHVDVRNFQNICSRKSNRQLTSPKQITRERNQFNN